MKRILSIMIALVLCFAAVSAFASCDKEPAVTTPETKAPEQSTEEQTEADTPAESVTEPAATTEEQTEPVTTAAKTEEATQPGGEVEYEEINVPLFEVMDPHVAVSADDGKELACKFSIQPNERLIGLFFESCPTWMVEDSSAFVVELYKWDGDYDNTILGDPLYSEEFTEWIDNAACEVYFDSVAPEGFASSGSFLWVFRGTNDKIGIWAMDPAVDCVYFENGIETSYGYRVQAIVLSPV